MANKEKIRASMLAHLEELGFPEEMTYQQVVDQCPNMWKKLEREGLLEPGMKYEAFFGHAQAARSTQEMMDGAEDIFEALKSSLGGL